MVDVLDYAEKLKINGFNFMNGPGYDPVSVTGQVASGLILFALQLEGFMLWI